MKKPVLLSVLIAVSCFVSAQEDTVKQPVFTPDAIQHDFGTIGENDGYAEHIFNFTNTGNAPLVISRVQASCGCTRPEWTTEPVEPGKSGVIIVSYNPKGRLGPINKTATVYTNEENGYKRHRLTILGNVVDKPRDPVATYIDTVGGVGLQRNSFVYNHLMKTESNKLSMFVKNYNDKTVYLSFDNLPDYITFKYPDSLKADWPGELVINLDGVKTADKRGRFIENYTLTVKDSEGETLGSKAIPTTVNYLDDFTALSPLQKVSSGSLDIPNAMIDFGTVKKGLFGGGNAKKQFTLVNKGKSDLILHSVSSDDARVHLPDLHGKTIKAGESLAVDITVKAKELTDSNIDTDIYIICNDPKGPVRMVKVDAKKAN